MLATIVSEHLQSLHNPIALTMTLLLALDKWQVLPCRRVVGR
ncbi:hypothetical protein VCR20J5_1240144 [Vibrio crassostreae]|nr:hypothetical protein VCR20J5_1240144 [Vibrio crassostreae]